MVLLIVIVAKEKKEIEYQYLKLVEFYKFHKVHYAKNLDFKKISDEKYFLNGKELRVTKYFSALLTDVNPGISYNTRQYIQFYKDKFFIIIGNGDIFFKLNQDSKDQQKISFKKISSNLQSIIGKEYLKIYPNNIMHFLIDDRKVYVSYMKKKNDSCYYGELVVANFDLNLLDFKPFYSINECNKKPGTFGGRLSSLNENSILYSVADAGNKSKPQSKKSLYGKILKINKLNSAVSILSSGLRDPQGLFYSKEDNIIFSTDHGPIGGDEVNFQNLNQEKFVNFGWPISSYGYHKPSETESIMKKYPYRKFHKKYNFKEPLFHANKISIPPTQIILANSFIKFKDKKVLYFGSLGWLVKIDSDPFIS